ncbi:Uncharacterized lipoprotein YddW, UPF0748 family [Lachnospiraceae bacterium XBB2008]|nr:Uncharacterized lipoprotein YddW, UPF0748 family [Lachnospiraceae bacterium XBB2008]
MNRTLIKITGVICAAMLFMLMPVSALAAEAVPETAQSAETGEEALSETGEETSEAVTVPAPAEFRAVWFSFRDWQTYLKGRNEQDFRSTFQTVCQNCRDNGLNAIIVHVRSHNDAAYPSSYYPWSDEMCGGDPGYDPFSIITEIAHSNGLQVHAWINPYGYRNGKYCGDRSLATKDNILAGVREILDKYDVEGIHFDDYFPPLGASAHNSLLKDVYNTVHSYGKTFGVSPSGNIDNNRRAGVDVDTWLANTGYIDYICPQIYWSNAYGKDGNVTMYSDRLAAWKGLNKAGIRMYIGLAAYRCGEVSKYDPGWSTRNTNLSGQVREMRDNVLAGYVLFSYSSIVSSKCSSEMSNLRALNQ